MSSQSKVSKKKPYVFYETSAVWQSRIKSLNEDSYMQLFSPENIEYHTQIKPLGNVKLKFLEDHIECKSTSLFGSRLPRNEISYSLIDRCLAAKEPSIIICLAINEGEDEKICEIFKFKTEQQTEEIQDLINKARQHSQYKLIDPSNTYHSGSITSLNEIDGHTLNNRHHSDDVSMSEMVETSRGSVLTLPKRHGETYRPALPMEKKKMNIEEPYIRANKDYLQRSSIPSNSEVSNSYEKPSTQVTYIKDDHSKALKNWYPQDIETLKQDLLKNVDNDTAWSVEVNCIENHPKYGNRISDNGSIYMFIAHMTPEHRNYSMCSSSNASLHSLVDEPAKNKVRAS